MNIIEIIKRLKRRVRDLSPETAPKFATIQDVERAETVLGFRLPEILRRVYLEVGNGFDVCYRPFLDIAAVANEYSNSFNDHAFYLPEWPVRLLPICNWGCNTYSCLDCTFPGTSVVRVDYNSGVLLMEEEYILTSDFQFFESYSNNEVAAWVESPTLEDWFSDWLEGANLFDQAYPSRKPKLAPQ